MWCDCLLIISRIGAYNSYIVFVEFRQQTISKCSNKIEDFRSRFATFVGSSHLVRYEVSRSVFQSARDSVSRDSTPTTHHTFTQVRSSYIG